jgi:EpsI family protein
VKIPTGLPARVLAVVLIAQAGAYYAVASRTELTPEIAPLATLPRRTANWNTVKEFQIEKAVQEVLRADDTVNRVYVDDAGTANASLFIAFFRTQREGQSPHSPKNCLPGAGWEPTHDRKLPIAVAGRAEPMVVNEYVIQRGNDASVVLYWYQSHGRVIASEFDAKFWLVADAIRQRRSDTALVRVIVPVIDGATETAERTAISFTQALYPTIAARLPR